MPKQRRHENKKLPPRWRWKHNAIYYRVPSGNEHLWEDKKEFLLGKSLNEAYIQWGKRIQHVESVQTVNELLDRYSLEVIPTKDVNTQEYNKRYVVTLKKAFGHAKITQIEPQHIYQFVDKRRVKYTDKNGKTRGGLSIAKREIAMFSDAFTKAVKWGYIKKHPFKGEVVLDGEKTRKRYVEDWEITEFLSLDKIQKNDSTKVIQAYVKIKLLTGMRQQDLLRLKITDLTEEGIEYTPRKTEKSSGIGLTIQWSQELRAAVEEAKKERPVDISPYLFCNRRGQSHWNEKTCKCSGWKSIWRRYMQRAMQETIIKEHFTEHDLRAKCGSDAESLERAKELLAHSEKSQITASVYRRKRKKVKPLR